MAPPPPRPPWWRPFARRKFDQEAELEAIDKMERFLRDPRNWS